jgi:hypothetical protein
MTVNGRVGRLALRASSRAAVDDFARQIETALALARWPYARPGEVILIRRLALDELPQGASVHALADLIGRRLVEIRPVRLRAGDPERPEAAAVVFAGRLEALAALATQLARHGAGRAWYWRRLVPPLAPSARLPDIALRLLVEAAAPPRGIAGTAAFAWLLLEAGALDAFVAALPAGAGAGFEEVRDAEPPPGPALPAAAPQHRITGQMEGELSAGEARAETWWHALPGAWRTALGRQARRLPQDDPRLVWLAVTALVASFGPSAGAPAAKLARRLVRLARQAGERPPPRDRPPAFSSVPAADPRAGSSSQAAAPDQRAPPHAPVSPTSSEVEPALGAGPVSSWAGLWLLPSALAQLRIAEVVSPYGPGLGVAFMRALAARLGVPDDDPALAALPEAAPDLRGAAPFLAPPAWRALAAPHPRAPPAFALRRAGRYRLLTDRAGRLPLALTRDRRELRRLTRAGPVRRRPDGGAPAPDLALRALHLALARYLGRAAGLSLRRLVRRPGTVIATATHVDVIFPGEVIELRLRRAGLDFDPGWVPWLGRVVAYHYDLERGRPG